MNAPDEDAPPPPDDDPKEDLRQGLGLLWRAARKVAGDVRKELDRSDVGRTLDDAGREIARAASNVIDRLGSELGMSAGPRRPEPPPWPTTREEYEERYGEVDGDWPRSPE